MPRITASVNAVQYEHVEAVADELDVSMAEVIRRLIDAHQSGDVKNDAMVHTDAHHDVLRDVMHGMEDADDRIRELESRIDELEEQVEMLTEEIEADGEEERDT